MVLQKSEVEFKNQWPFCHIINKVSGISDPDLSP